MFRRSTASSFVLGALVFGAWVAPQGLTPKGWPGDSPLRNYGAVWEHKLTRSGMAYFSPEWKWLQKQGVTSVVTFRPENDVNYQEFGFEHILQIPLTGHVLPTEEQADRYLRIIQGNQPVHIHCTAGRSRTGVMAALTRYAVDGRSLDSALAEARTYRDGKELSPAMIAWLRDCASRHLPGSYRLHESATRSAFKPVRGGR